MQWKLKFKVPIGYVWRVEKHVDSLEIYVKKPEEKEWKGVVIEKESWIQVDEGIYVFVNHDFEEFSVVCQGKGVKVPVASIIYVLLANKDKLYVADLGVVEDR